MGAEGGEINVVGLARWVKMMFAEESQADFEAGMKEMLGVIPELATLAPGVLVVLVRLRQVQSGRRVQMCCLISLMLMGVARWTSQSSPHCSRSV